MLYPLIAGCLDVLCPESCAACGIQHGEADWFAPSRHRAHGLRPWDGPHLCARCFESAKGPVLRTSLDGIPLLAARPASSELVELVGRWKYDGIRGLGQPLAAWLAPVIRQAMAAHGPVVVLPVPLHRGRRRERGFDQVLMLASLAARLADASLRTRILRRRRHTAQQARCETEGEARRQNVTGAFSTTAPCRTDDRGLLLVDDLATTGATLLAAASSLQSSGWQVKALATVGAAARLELQTLDTEPVRSEAVDRNTVANHGRSRPDPLEAS